MKFTAPLLLAGAGAAGAFAPTTFVGRSNTAVDIAVGDKIPAGASLMKDFPDPDTNDIAEYAKGKNMIIVGLPGAFTPTCSNQQVPGYIEAGDDLKAAGVDEVLVYCVNDAAVMQAWADDQDSVGTIVKMMADPSGSFTDAVDMKMKHPEGPASVGILGRCKRYAMHVVDGEVKYIATSETETDPAGDDDPSASCAPAMLKAIKD